MSDPVKVRLASPAKVGTRWLAAGEEAEVTADERQALLDAGLIATPRDAAEPAALPEPGWTAAQFDEAVKAEALKMAGQAFDGELGRIEAELKQIVAEAGSLEAEAKAQKDRADAATAEADALRARVQDLEAQLAAAAALTNPTDTPPEPAAKTTRKKGAAATTAG